MQSKNKEEFIMSRSLGMFSNRNNAGTTIAATTLAALVKTVAADCDEACKDFNIATSIFVVIAVGCCLIRTWHRNAEQRRMQANIERMANMRI
jgi:hypothetical protein